MTNTTITPNKVAITLTGIGGYLSVVPPASGSLTLIGGVPGIGRTSPQLAPLTGVLSLIGLSYGASGLVSVTGSSIPTGLFGLPNPASGAPSSSTFVQFVPSTTTAFSFNPVLNGTQYNATVTWNAFGQRYYLTLTDLTGNLIICRSISSTAPGLQASFTWAFGVTEVVTTANHNVPIGEVVNMRASGTKSIMDGLWQALSVSPDTLIYEMTTDPDAAVPFSGVVDFPLNLVGEFDIGMLVFHWDSQQFEFA